MWTKANQAAMNRLNSQCQVIVPASVKERTAKTAQVTETRQQTLPNRATHLGVLIEWAAASGYHLELVKDS